MDKKVCCVTCGKMVDVKTIKYGEGQVAICPLCGKLAYNKKGE